MCSDSVDAIREIKADDIVALGLKLATMSQSHDSAPYLTSSEDRSILNRTPHTLLLMHALLLFPTALQSLLSKLEANGGQRCPGSSFHIWHGFWFSRKSVNNLIGNQDFPVVNSFHKQGIEAFSLSQSYFRRKVFRFRLPPC